MTFSNLKRLGKMCGLSATFELLVVMGELAIAARITCDRWRHMFEAEVVFEATVDMVVQLYSA